MHAYAVNIVIPVEQTITRLKELLAAEKMGVVSEVDIQAVMKNKLDHDMPAYKMLGVCGPGYAKRVLEADADLGAILPCGCVVYETANGTTRVAIRNPDTVSVFSDRPEVKAAMDEARVVLERIIERLAIIEH